MADIVVHLSEQEAIEWHAFARAILRFRPEHVDDDEPQRMLDRAAARVQRVTESGLRAQGWEPTDDGVWLQDLTPSRGHRRQHRHRR